MSMALLAVTVRALRDERDAAVARAEAAGVTLRDQLATAWSVADDNLAQIKALQARIDAAAAALDDAWEHDAAVDGSVRWLVDEIRAALGVGAAPTETGGEK